MPAIWQGKTAPRASCSFPSCRLAIFAKRTEQVLEVLTRLPCQPHFPHHQRRMFFALFSANVCPFVVVGSMLFTNL